MRAAVRVEARVVGRRAALEPREVTVDLPASATLRDLLVAAVHEEVASHDARREEAGLLQVLSADELADGLARGVIRSAPVDRDGVEAPGAVDLDEAVAAALLAFEDGLFKVVVDDRPITSLDESVEVPDGATVLFLRLVALSGRG